MKLAYALRGHVLAHALGIAGLVACGPTSSDEPIGSFEQMETAGMKEGSPEAAIVLRVANTATAEDLQTKGNVAQRTAEAIRAVRVGDDGTAGTNDDGFFATLAELDSVPFVDATVFPKLLAYGKAQGYLDVQDDQCQGPNLESTDVAPLFEPGAKSTLLGSYRVEARGRHCSAGTCQAWILSNDPLNENFRFGGETRISRADSTNELQFSFVARGGLWSTTSLGNSPDATAMNALLKDPTGWVFETGPIRQRCAVLRATKIKSYGSGTSDEYEVTVRAGHAPSAQTNDWFKSPRDVRLSCVFGQRGAQWTCQGLYDYQWPDEVDMTVQLSADGQSLTIDDMFKDGGTFAIRGFHFDKTHQLTDGAIDVQESTRPSRGSQRLSAKLSNRMLSIDLSGSSAHEPNFCGVVEGRSISCTARVVPEW